jgi:hypothetical protein
MPVITVNGKLWAVQPHLDLSFHDIAGLAKIPGVPSMTLRMRRQRDQPQPEARIVYPGEAFPPVDGMIFTVADTGNA